MRRLLALGGVTASECWTDLGEGRLFHLAAGEGEPVVLLQGAGGGAANWYRLLGPLSRRRRTLAPELPGFGLSDPIASDGPLGEAAADTLERWLNATVDARRVDVIATSFGGLAALRLAMRGRVRRLVLLNAAGLGRGIALPVRLATLPGARRLLASPSRSGTRILFRVLLTSNRSALPREHQRALVEYAWCSAAGGAAETLERTMPRFVGVGGQREVLSAAELESVDAPVLLVWGTADRFLPPRQGSRAVRLIPRATWVPLDGVGHSPNWEAPEEVLQVVLPFLNSA